MKNKDITIIAHLRNNARKSLTDISRQTKIPITTIFERIKEISKDKICKNTALLNFHNMGYPVWIIMAIKVKRESKEKIASFLTNCNNVNNLYKINNGFDYMLEGVFKSLIEFEEFYDLVDQKFAIQEKNVYYLINPIKRESFLCNLNDSLP